MAHKGRQYPYAVNRDLMVWQPFPNWFSERLIWRGDTIIMNGHNELNRNGIPSDPAVRISDGTGLAWHWVFLTPTAPNYTVTVYFHIVEFGKDLDLHMVYEDDDGNEAEAIWFNWGRTYGQVMGPAWSWDTATPPPAFSNTGSANVHWLLPGGNDFWLTEIKLW